MAQRSPHNATDTEGQRPPSSLGMKAAPLTTVTWKAPSALCGLSAYVSQQPSLHRKCPQSGNKLFCS
ncbi:hypothetical protein J4Q44_G00221510 [Coregonus suidteri]|uniref:Uncharacterized protein n=1 Tax=Coregonus suidteri TaxID=861788 RepID=A0AAN8L861_9TELE